MKDSRRSDITLAESRRPPHPHGTSLPHAVEPQEKQPLGSSLANQAGTRCSWLRTAALVTVAIAGAAGLTRLAHHVTTPQSEGNGGIIIRNELISLRLAPGLLDLARCPEDAAACQTLEGFRRYAEKRGLEKARYVIISRGYQVNGETIVLSTIRRPYDLIEPYYPEFLDILAIAAEKPRHHPLIDHSGDKIGVIPDHLLDADPRTVVDELRMLDDQPAQRATR